MSEIKLDHFEIEDRDAAFDRWWSSFGNSFPETVPGAMKNAFRELAENGFKAGVLWHQIRAIEALKSISGLK